MIRLFIEGVGEMIDMYLHIICSMLIFVGTYLLTDTKTAIIVTLAAGIGKEVVDSFTHAPEVIDLVSDGIGILIGMCVIKGSK